MGFISEIIEYRFLSNAVLACILAGAACGVAGSYIVCRRQVFLSGGITHASFGGIGIAYFLGANPLMGALAFALASALGIEAFSQKKKIREDSAIGILWSVGMAVGIVFIYLTPGYAPNLMTFLFGNLMSVTRFDIAMMSVVVILIAVVFMALYRPILYTAFDPVFAASQKIPVALIGYLMAALTAVTIVISIRMVGVVLLISLLTLPAVTANLITKSMGKIIPIAVVIAVMCSLAGLYLSYHTDLPSGATIIFMLCIVLLAVKPLSLLFR